MKKFLALLGLKSCERCGKTRWLKFELTDFNLQVNPPKRSARKVCGKCWKNFP